MVKFILIGIIVIFLLLDWAALDDITTGKEPSFFAEYLILIISAPVVVIIGYLIYRNKHTKHKLGS